jgi:hypothetical protein
MNSEGNIVTSGCFPETDESLKVYETEAFNLLPFLTMNTMSLHRPKRLTWRAGATR